MTARTQVRDLNHHYFTKALADLTRWIGSDCTIPLPDTLTIVVEADSAEAVATFAIVNGLDAPRPDGAGNVYAAACFGPVRFRVQAENAKAAS